MAGGQGGHEDAELVALARAGRADEQGVPAQEQDPAGTGVFAWAEVHWLSDRPRGWAGPRDDRRVRFGVEDTQFAPVGLVVSCADADGAAVGAERGFDRGYAAGQVGNSLSVRQLDVRPPSPLVNSGGLDLGPGKADRPSDIGPGGECALHVSPGTTSAVRPPGNWEDERAEEQNWQHR